MRRGILIAVSAAICFFSCSSEQTLLKDPELKQKYYSSLSLPENLIKDANILVRYSDESFYVKSPSSAVEKAHEIITVLNKNGRGVGEITLDYDKFSKIKNFKGYIRNKKGDLVREITKDMMHDFSATSDYSLYDDHRVFSVDILYDDYPYTIEYSYTIEHDGLIGWSTWYPQTRDASVQLSRFTLDIPKGTKFRYINQNLDLAPTVSSDKNREIYTWELKDKGRLEWEHYGPNRQVPKILFTPYEFEIEGKPGSIADWESFGKWSYELNKDRNKLPDNIKETVDKIKQTTATELELIQKLYEYMQSKTRYVSVQLGIGGWQTFDAEYVAQRSYGDCKALTNYMKSLLDYAGVESYAALTNLSYNIIPDFPANQFNHVILCVPQTKDTVWLECTSQSMPFGHVGDSNEGKHVLLITPDGGDLVKIPNSNYLNNRQIRKAIITLDENGAASAKVNVNYTGNQQDVIRSVVYNLSEKDRTKWLYDRIKCPSFNLQNVSFSAINKKTAVMNINYELTSSHYAVKTDKRMIITNHLINSWGNIPPDYLIRTHPVTFDYAFMDSDTLIYKLPEGYGIEAVPNPVSIEHEFGNYSLKYEYEKNGQIIFIRSLSITGTQFPKERYNDFRNFIKNIIYSDKAQLVLVKNQ